MADRAAVTTTPVFHHHGLGNCPACPPTKPCLYHPSQDQLSEVNAFADAAIQAKEECQRTCDATSNDLSASITLRLEAAEAAHAQVNAEAAKVRARLESKVAALESRLAVDEQLMEVSQSQLESEKRQGEQLQALMVSSNLLRHLPKSGPDVPTSRQHGELASVLRQVRALTCVVLRHRISIWTAGM